MTEVRRTLPRMSSAVALVLVTAWASVLSAALMPAWGQAGQSPAPGWDFRPVGRVSAAGPRVLLIYDMEGLAGQTSPATFRFNHQEAYPRGREYLVANLNAVIAVETSLTPHHLWTMLASIELAQGRVRGTRPNAARTLDIDVLLIDDIVMNSSDLTLPHPRMHLRKFVLVPLLEIAPDICIPGWGAASKLLAHTVDSEPRKLGHNRAWN